MICFSAFSNQSRQKNGRPGESNPQPAVLETAALPIELLAFKHYCVCGKFASAANLTNLDTKSNPGDFTSLDQPSYDLCKDDKALPLPSHSNGVTAPQFALLVDNSSDDTGTYRTPAFTNREAQTVVHAIGQINSTTILTLSPGITISTPSGNSQAPVTSVVRK